MNERALEQALRDHALGDAEVVARVQARLPALVAATPSADRSRRTWWWLAGVAATAFAIAGTWAWPRPRASGTDGATAQPSFDEPPGFTSLAAAADLVAIGSVRTLGSDTIEFGIDRVLRGPAKPRTITWPRGRDGEPDRRVDARVLLFARRDPTSGAMRPALGDASAFAFEDDEFDGFSLDDLQHAVEHGVLAPARVVELLRRDGPRALQRVEFHFQTSATFAMPVDATDFQAVLVRWLQRCDVMHVDRHELLTATRWLREAGTEALGIAGCERLAAAWPRIHADVNGRFDAATFLAPFVRADVAWARTALRDVLAAIATADAAARQPTLATSYHVELLELAARIDRAAAVATAHGCLAHAGDDETIDRWLWFLLRQDPTTTTPRVLARTRERLAAGAHAIGLGPLLACAPSDAMPVLRAAFPQPAFARIHVRYDRVLRDVLAAARPNPVLFALRDELRARVADGAQPFAEYELWLSLFRAGGGAFVEARGLRELVQRGLPEGVLGIEFVRELEVWSGRRTLAFAAPTAAELAAAAWELVR